MRIHRFWRACFARPALRSVAFARPALHSVGALGFALAVFLAAGAPRAQGQHGYSQDQIDQGRQLYESNCGRCHNDDGAGVPGIELFKQIKRASTDDDVAKLIQTGIPGTSMPSHSFGTPQALSVVAYLRSMVGVTVSPRPAAGGASTIAGLTGDAAHGKDVFESKGACLSCHAINGAGATTAPDLGAPAAGGRGGRGGRGGGAPVNAAALERSILEPDADVAVPYRVFQVVTKSGQTVRGTLLNQDPFSIQMRDQAGDLRAFQKSDLTSSGFQPSPMPSYRGRLTNQELADVIAYLLSLRTPR
jgi:putative heme-binding domain-containing protein